MVRALAYLGSPHLTCLSSTHAPVHAGSCRASRSGFYPGSCRGQAAARTAQSDEQKWAGGGAREILGTLGAGLAWPHTGLTGGRSMGEKTKIRGLGASQPQGPTRKGQGVTHHCPPPTPAL